MDCKIVFLHGDKINMLQNGTVTVLNSAYAENYLKKDREIKKKNEWKKAGVGARFMGVNIMPADENAEPKLSINGVAKYSNDKVVYTLNTGSVGGLYVKDVSNPTEPETYIVVNNKMNFFDIDVNSTGGVVTSITDSYFERHLALTNVRNSNFDVLTEGDSFDANPKWSRKDENIVYYDSCGVGLDANGNFVKYGPKGICRLNVKTGDLDEVISEDGHDFYRPYEDRYGNLFYIKRPYESKKQSVSLKDALLMPVKILKALFGWLNFFTQRYAGESLKTSGNNPAKTGQKSPEQIFVDGNLLEVEKNMKANAAKGEKNPGYVPMTWELMIRTQNGEERVIKKGVLDYCVSEDNSIIYSNGKYIIRLTETNGEEIPVKAHPASKIICM